MSSFKFGKKANSSQPSSSQSLSSRDTAWNSLLSTLPIVEQSLGGVPVPGVKVAVGGLLEVLKGLDVRERFSSLLYQALTQLFGAYKTTHSTAKTVTELCEHVKTLKNAVLVPIQECSSANSGSTLPPELDQVVKTLTSYV